MGRIESQPRAAEATSPAAKNKAAKKTTYTRRTFNNLLTGALSSIGISSLFPRREPRPRPFEITFPDSQETIAIPLTYEETLIPPPTDLAAATNRTGFIRLDDGRDVIFNGFTGQGEIKLTGWDGKTKLADPVHVISNSVTVVNRNDNVRQATTTVGSFTDPEHPKHSGAWFAPVDEEEDRLREKEKGTFYQIKSPFVDKGELCVFAERNMPSDYLWDHYGTDLTILDISTDSPSVKDIIPLPRPDANSPLKINWGVAVTQDENYTYIYGHGTKSDKNQKVVGHDLRVARVKKGAVTDLTKWQFKSKKGWETQDPRFEKEKAFKTAESKSAAIIDHNVGTSINAHQIDDMTVVVGKRIGVNAVDGYLAKSPAGPFKRVTLVNSLPDYTKTTHKPTTGHAQVNAVWFHPEAFSATKPEENLLIASIGPSANFEQEVSANITTCTDVPLFFDFKDAVH